MLDITKVLVTGDRKWDDYATVYRALEPYVDEFNSPFCLVHGDASGADRMSEKVVNDMYRYLRERRDDCTDEEFEQIYGKKFIVKKYPAPWNDVEGKPTSQIGFRQDGTKYWKAAGPARNREMLKEKPDIVLAFHNDIEKSKGTKDMVMAANKAGIIVCIYPEDSL